MDQPPSSPGIEPAIAALAGVGELRVWSLIVTLFGDMARQPGEHLSGAQLSQITGRIGIKPEAMRVALHRLRKDGWIASTRVGRSSHYALTPFGCAEATRASRRIYAAEPDDPGSWHLLIAEPMAQAERQELDQAMQADGYVSPVQGSYLGRGSAPDRPGFFAMNGEVAIVPSWLKQALMPERLLHDYAALETVLEQVAAGLEPMQGLNDTDTAALRALVVHGWRRLLLRHPDLPDRFFPEASRAPACRALVGHLLALLPKPDPAPAET